MFLRGRQENPSFILYNNNIQCDDDDDDDDEDEDEDDGGHIRNKKI